MDLITSVAVVAVSPVLVSAFNAAAYAGVALAQRWPRLYSDSIENYFKRKNFPADILQDFDTKKIHVLREDSALRKMIESRTLVDQEIVNIWRNPEQNLARKFAKVASTVSYMIPYMILSLAKGASLVAKGGAYHLQKHPKQDALLFLPEKNIQLPPRLNTDPVKHALLFCKVAHELRHTEHPVLSSAFTQAGNEGDADTYALAAAKRAFPEINTAEIMKYHRAMSNLSFCLFAGARGDDTALDDHNTAPFIEAWENGKPPPSPQEVWDANLQARFVLSREIYDHKTDLYEHLRNAARWDFLPPAARDTIRLWAKAIEFFEMTEKVGGRKAAPATPQA